MKSCEPTLANAHPDQPDKGGRLDVLPNDESASVRDSSGYVNQHTPDDFAFLRQREIEHYLFAVESSVKVRSGHQFFLWAQGQLQSLIAHEVLFCVHGNLDRQEFTAVRYSPFPFRDAHFAEICDPQQGLLSQMISAWHRNGEEPCLVCAGNGSAAADPRIEALIGRYDLANLACHGTQNIDGGTNSCFVFARMPQPPGKRQCYLLKLLVPHLHAAFVRTLIHGARRPHPPAAAPQRALSGRELEILRWVSEGRSNLQIGRTLRISPLTVKNHVQHILKKLEVRNRTQAVSRAISLKLIESSYRQP